MEGRHYKECPNNPRKKPQVEKGCDPKCIPCPCNSSPPPFMRTPSHTCPWDANFVQWSGWNWVKRGDEDTPPTPPHTESRCRRSKYRIPDPYECCYDEKSEHVLRKHDLGGSECRVKSRKKSPHRSPHRSPQRRKHVANTLKSFCKMWQCTPDASAVRKLDPREKTHLQSYYSTPCASLQGDVCDHHSHIFNRDNVPNCLQDEARRRSSKSTSKSKSQSQSHSHTRSQWPKEQSDTTTCTEDCYAPCNEPKKSLVYLSRKPTPEVQTGDSKSSCCSCSCGRGNSKCFVICPQLLEGIVVNCVDNNACCTPCVQCCGQPKVVDTVEASVSCRRPSVDKGISVQCLCDEKVVQTMPTEKKKKHCCCCSKKDRTQQICTGTVVPVICCPQKQKCAKCCRKGGDEVLLAQQINFILKMKSSMATNTSNVSVDKSKTEVKQEIKQETKRDS